jgi:hypothetical protein
VRVSWSTLGKLALSMARPPPPMVVLTKRAAVETLETARLINLVLPPVEVGASQK